MLKCLRLKFIVSILNTGFVPNSLWVLTAANLIIILHVFSGVQMQNPTNYFKSGALIFRRFSTSSNINSHVLEVLRNKGHNFEAVTLSANTRTANDAAVQLGCDVDQIVKSILFRAQDSNQPILVLASGANQVNEQVVGNVAKQMITKADAKFTKEVTGFPIQCIPPLGHRSKIETYIDQDLFKFEYLWASLDKRNMLFSLRSKDLNVLIDGNIISINNNPCRLRRI